MYIILMSYVINLRFWMK